MSRMMMMGKGSRRAGASGYTAQGVAFNNSPYLTGTANTDFARAQMPQMRGVWCRKCIGGRLSVYEESSLCD
jgi:hypothetical protein